MFGGGHGGHDSVAGAHVHGIGQAVGYH